MLRFETCLWGSGHDAVAGVDEAGMSPLAGPVSAGAAILRPGIRIVGIDDSKNLTPRLAKNLRTRLRKRQRVGVWRSPKLKRSTRSTSIGQASKLCNVRSGG
jgi:ribonuclease HII